MKSLGLAIILVCTTVFSSFSANKPVAGKTFSLVYDASASGVLSDANQVWVVYALDYWGTTAVQKLRGEGGPSDLFQNVLNPDPGRAFKVAMVKREKLWTADISIPAGAMLLSYYVTDGDRSDFNDRKTYVSYIYDDRGNPVRGSRFRNVDFLFMAGKTHSEILKEIHDEFTHYPDNFIAHTIYWRFRFFETISPDTLTMLVSESDRHFADLHRQYGDTVLNYKALSLHDIDRIVQLSLRSRMQEPIVANLITSVNTDILASIKRIPFHMRLQRVVQLQPLAEYLLMPPKDLEELERASRKQFDEMMAEFVGRPAPDFSFKTLSGQQHRLSDFRGKYVLLDFWGSWCGPCVQEIPTLLRVHETYGDRGLVMISVSNDASASKWNEAKLADYVDKKGMKWMQVLDETTESIHDLYKVQFWPNVFLIDKQGVVLQRQGLRGEELMQRLSTLLSK
jgi:thiol-disulfide isomerase/thioredoxin